MATEFCPAGAGGKIGRQRIDIENFDKSEGQAATKCDQHQN